MPDYVCISRRQRNLHVAGEAMAVFLVSPFLAILALRGGRLTTMDRYALAGIVVGSLAIDGHLLRRYLGPKRHAPDPPWDPTAQ